MANETSNYFASIDTYLYDYALVFLWAPFESFSNSFHFKGHLNQS